MFWIQLGWAVLGAVLVTVPGCLLLGRQMRRHNDRMRELRTRARW